MGFFKEILSKIQYNVSEAEKGISHIVEAIYSMNNKLSTMNSNIKLIKNEICKSDIDVTKCCCEEEKKYRNMGTKAILDEWAKRQAEIMILENELRNKNKTLNND